MSDSVASANWVLEQWRTICAEAFFPIAVFDRESRFLAASEPWITEFEHGNHQVIGCRYSDVHPEAAEPWHDIHRRVLAGEVVRQEHQRIDLGDHGERWGRSVSTPWRLPDNSIGGHIWQIHRVDRTSVAYQRRVAADQELHLALKSARAGTWEVDLETFENKWSDETWRLYGLTPGEVEPSSMAWAATIVPEERDHVNRVALDALARRVEVEVEWRVNCPDEERWLLARGQPVVESDGSIRRYIGTVIDITPQRKLERELSHRSQELKLILDALPVAVARVNRDSRYTFVNHFYQSWFGIPNASIVGMRVDELIGTEGMIIAKPRLQAVLDGQPQVFENQIRFADGQLHTLSVRFVPDRSTDDRVIGFYVMTTDITESKIREAEAAGIRQRFDDLTRRQVAQQTLMAVTHELRQPLQASAIFAEVACREIETPRHKAQAVHAVTRMREEVGRANEMLSQLFSLIRSSDQMRASELMPLNFGEFVTSSVAHHAAHYPCLMSCLVVDPVTEILEVQTNPAALEKILANLIRNANEALGCAERCAPGALVTVRTFRHGDRAVVCVEDNAGGISQAVRAHLFEPFQSTKPEGLGIGLSISKQLAEHQNGRLWHEDRPGGSAFLLSLPLRK